MLNPLTKLARRIRIKLQSEHSLRQCPDLPLISKIKDKNLTYLSASKLASISTTCRNIEKQALEGYFIEAGCALGGSSILIGSLKSPHRHLNVYDVFGLIPSPTEDDPSDVQQRYQTIIAGKSVGIGGDKYYGYEDNLEEKVKNNFTDFGLDLRTRNIHLIKGLLQDTMQLDSEVAFAHIDVDWYDPVKTSLERIFPRLVIGGSIILDDYHDWGGCRKAVDEFLRTVIGLVSMDDSAGSLKITRIKR